MVETSSNAILLLEMGAFCVEEPPIWISVAIALEDEEAGLNFGVIYTVKLVLKTMKMKKSFKLFLILDTKLNEEEEESNDDSWKTVVFYKHNDPQRYAAHVSMPNPRPTRGKRLKWTRISRVKGKDIPSTSPDMWQRTQNARLAFNKAASLQRSRLFSKAKAASSQQSRATSSLQRSRPFRGRVSSAN